MNALTAGTDQYLVLATLTGPCFLLLIPERTSEAIKDDFDFFRLPGLQEDFLKPFELLSGPTDGT